LESGGRKGKNVQETHFTQGVTKASLKRAGVLGGDETSSGQPKERRPFNLDSTNQAIDAENSGRKKDRAAKREKRIKKEGRCLVVECKHRTPDLQRKDMGDGFWALREQRGQE